MRKALIIWGGWEGHEPFQVSELFAEILAAENFEVEISNQLDAWIASEQLFARDLIVPVITMSTLERVQLDGVLGAVRDHGVGIAGCHGGMCDAFRSEPDWQFMTGGQWVAHPGNDGVHYTVNIRKENPHPITEGIDDFEVESEQYYLLVDPGVNVLATTRFPHPGVDGPHVANPCEMPQLWTKQFGRGRVFYNALGHSRAVVEAAIPRELMRRGFLWAAR